MSVHLRNPVRLPRLTHFSPEVVMIERFLSRLLILLLSQERIELRSVIILKGYCIIMTIECVPVEMTGHPNFSSVK